MNLNVKILSRRLYASSLKNAGWIEGVRLIILIFHTFVCNIFSRAVPSTLPNLKLFESYLRLDSRKNSVISDRFAYPSRWRRKP